ncbi:MAG: UDP-N-acetylmuramoyl-tripeptide--D-alanyl-D-alanine ligase [Chloroflexi bacterium]|nr:UDP-N-acetylmuramoyl-tripeptide--D-alanyl-D-alanine ligase [Chloroflexota bacterium]
MIAATEIAESLGSLLRERRAGAAARFRSVVIDSRQAGRGDLFVALPGERTDGHEFVLAAVAAGARGVLVRTAPDDLPDGIAAFVVGDTLAALQRLAAGRRDRRRARVIGVTGSVGKTTTKEITASVLSTRYEVLKNEANYNNEIGLPLTLLELRHRHRRAVLEMGMYALGEIRTLCEIARPDVGVVTNVGPAHLERMGSLEAIAAAKAELPESLPPHGFAVLNADDPLVMAMADRTRARPLSYGTAADADVRASEIESRGLEGVSFRLHWHGESARVETKLPGRHSVSNALAAAAVALADGMPLADVAAALGEVQPPLRIQVHRLKGGGTLLDDTYNAGPASMAAALDLLAEIPGRRIAVLGDMLELGPAEREEHLALGRRAAETVDVLHTVGELGALIAEAAREAGLRETHHWPDKDAAGEALAADLRQDDVVLLKASRALALETLVPLLKERDG